jgi:hypothetical protein
MNAWNNATRGDPVEVFTGKGGRRPGAGRRKGGTNAAPSASREFSTEKAAAILDMAEARAKKESYLAHLAEIEYKQKRGELLSQESVYQALDTAASAFREQLLTIPGRFASIFAAEGNAKTIEQTLENELRRALEHVTDVRDEYRRADD